MTIPAAFEVIAEWDDAAQVWVATSRQLPLRPIKSPTLDGLIKEIQYQIGTAVHHCGLRPSRNSTFTLTTTHGWPVPEWGPRK